MIRFLLPLILAATPAAAAPADSEKRAILATVQEFFDALAARDAERVKRLVVTEGTIAGHDSRAPAAGLFVERWPAWAEGLRSGSARLEERMHRARVRIRGTMGSVWTSYSFYRDGKFSHCGIDNFDMAKVEGRWKILNLTFTMESKGCRR